LTENGIKVTQIVENFPGKKIRELKLSYFKVKDSFFDDEEELEQAKKRRLKELREKIRKRVYELY
jgi:dephospho-CoA kinase